MERWIITRVENGFMVDEQDVYHGPERHREGGTWVAQDVERLVDLVAKLVTKEPAS